MLACIEYLQTLSEYESSQDAYLNFQNRGKAPRQNCHDGHSIQVAIIHDQVRRLWSLVKLCSHPVYIVSIARWQLGS